MQKPWSISRRESHWQKNNEIICLEKTADWEMAKEKMSEYQAAYPEDESVAKEAEFLQTR